MSGPDPDGAERVRFFPGQILSAADFEAEQAYHRRRLRDHNRFLHGWGVVAGLEVQPGGDGSPPATVEVAPGFALSPQGDQIRVDEPIPLHVVTGGGEKARAHVAIRHAECPTRPVPAADGEGDEHSRMRDGFELTCLQALPETTDPWIVLATLTLEETRITDIDLTDRRDLRR
jgi:hypothetical protein